MPGSPVRPFILGIGGGSASGKSTLARMLQEELGNERAEVILLDAYYHCGSSLSLEQRAARNYDHPEAFEFSLLAAQLAALSSGAPVEMPVYDYASHCRGPRRLIAPRAVLIVEGILALYDPAVRERLHYSVFVDAPLELRLGRRLRRDVAERARTENSIRRQWLDTVEPMYQLYCAPTRAHARETLDGSSLDREVARSLLSRAGSGTGGPE